MIWFAGNSQKCYSWTKGMLSDFLFSYTNNRTKPRNWDKFGMVKWPILPHPTPSSLFFIISHYFWWPWCCTEWPFVHCFTEYKLFSFSASIFISQTSTVHSCTPPGSLQSLVISIAPGHFYATVVFDDPPAMLLGSPPSPRRSTPSPRRSTPSPRRSTP